MNIFITFLLDFIQGIKSIKSMNLISNSKLFLSTNLKKKFLILVKDYFFLKE